MRVILRLAWLLIVFYRGADFADGGGPARVAGKQSQESSYLLAMTVSSGLTKRRVYISPTAPLGWDGLSRSRQPAR